MPRPPGVARVGSVALGGRIPELLEGVAAFAQVPAALDLPLQGPGVDLGAVLREPRLLKLRRELVDGPVQPRHLHVQRADDATQQRFAFVEELGIVGGDLVHEGVEERIEAREGFGFIPDRSRVGFAGVRPSAEVLEVFADDRSMVRVGHKTLKARRASRLDALPPEGFPIHRVPVRRDAGPSGFLSGPKRLFAEAASPIAAIPSALQDRRLHIRRHP